LPTFGNPTLPAVNEICFPIFLKKLFHGYFYNYLLTIG